MGYPVDPSIAFTLPANQRLVRAIALIPAAGESVLRYAPPGHLVGASSPILLDISSQGSTTTVVVPVELNQSFQKGTAFKSTQDGAFLLIFE